MQGKTYDFQIIANLMAGSGATGKKLEALEQFLSAYNKTFTILKIEKPTPISKLPDGGNKITEAVICLGGDGTVSETIGYMIDKKITLPLAVIPTGTANIIAASFDIENHGDDFSFLLDKKVKKIDIGIVDYGKQKIYSLLGFGLGFEENYLHTTKRASKSILGVFSYIFWALAELFFLKKIPVEIVSENQQIKVNVCTLLALNIWPKILNFFPLFKKQSISCDNGKIGIFYVEYKNFLHAFLGTLVLHVLGEKNFGLVKFIEGSEFEIKSPAVVSTQIDGELRGNLPVTIKVLPQAFEFWL